MKETEAESHGLKQKTQQLTEHLGDLLESYYRLGVINVTDKASGIASFTLTLLIISFMTLFVLLFLGFGLGWWLGEKLDNMLAGFAIVSAFFLSLIFIVIAFRKQLLLPVIRNIIIKSVYE